MLSYLFAFSVRFYANAHSPRSGKGQLAQQVVSEPASGCLRSKLVSEQRERVVRFKSNKGSQKKALAKASAFFNDVFRKRNVMFPTEVMCASRVKCAFVM